MIEVEAHVHITRNGSLFLSPSRVQLLLEVKKQGSLNAAAKTLGMSYQHAWNLVAEMNGTGAEPVVNKRRGGARGGGAAVTTYGMRVLTDYQSIMKMVNQLIAPVKVELNL